MKNFTFSIKTSLVTAILGLLAFSPAKAQKILYPDAKDKAGYTLVEQDRNGISVRYSVNSFSIVPIEIDGRQMNNIEISGSWLPNDAGAPNLPGGGRLIAIRQGSVPVLKILSLHQETYNEIEVAPAPRIPKDNDPGPVQYPTRTDIYATNALYPASPVTLSAPSKIRGVDVVMLGVAPFQYNPVTKELVVNRDIELRIEFEGGNDQFGEERLRSRFWDPILEDAVLNYASLPGVDYEKRGRSGRIDGAEYLIIVPNGADYMNWANEIRHFRIKQGITTEIRTLNDIGGSTDYILKTFITNVYNTWDPVPAAILLMGDYGTNADKNIISPIYDGFCASDNILGDVDNNNLPDIVMARMTANNNTELETFVTKCINYEMNPPTSAAFYDHPITTIGWDIDRWFQINAESIGGYFRNVQGKHPVRINSVRGGDPNTDPWSVATNTEVVLEEFGPTGLGYIPATPQQLGGFTGGDAEDLNNAINDGAFFLQHRDHGTILGFQEPLYTTADLDGLYNTDLSFIFSTNCTTGKFNSSNECFSEKFHRYRYNDENSGALGVISASEESYSFVNDTYVWGLYDNMWPDFMPEYGSMYEDRGLLPAFANEAGKYFLYQSNWPWNTEEKTVTYHLFHHFGDAFQTLYSEVPEPFKIRHDEVIYAGMYVFTMEVDSGSTICLTVGDDIIGMATGSGVQQAVVVEPQPIGAQVTLTVTMTNYLRHEETIPVIPSEGAYCQYAIHSVSDAETGNGNGMADYNETVALDLGIKNVGLWDGNNISATITTSDPYVTIIDDEEFYGSIASGQTLTIDDGFSIHMAENTPDQHKVQLHLAATDGNLIWNSSFTLTANAPHLNINKMTFNDQAYGNGNGIMDPGEHVELTFNYTNTGHATAYDVDVSLESQSGYAEVLGPEQNFASIGYVGPYNKTFQVVVDPDAPEGILIHFRNELKMGNYSGAKLFSRRIRQNLEDFETGDFEKYDWELSGDIPWVITNQYPYEGIFSAKSGAIADLESSVLEITYNVMEDDSISFIRKVSSESWDRLKFYINDELLADWSGTSQGWRRAAFSVTSGLKTFKWEYAKNAFGTGGADKAWLDNICLPAPITLTIWAGPDDASCTGEPYQLEKAYGTDYAGINWTTSGTGTFDDNTTIQPTYTPSQEDEIAGSVTLTLTLTGNNGTEVADEMVLTFKSGPVAPEDIQGPDYVDLFYNSTSDYVSGGIEDIMNYNWYLQPNEAGTIEGNWLYSKVTWDSGYLGTAYITVAGINDCGEGDISEAFEVTVGNTVGIAETEAPEITLYPNPGTGRYHLILNKECQGQVRIKVINLTGNIVYECSKQAGNLHHVELDLGRLPGGIYFLKVEGDCTSILRKIVKE